MARDTTPQVHALYNVDHSALQQVSFTASSAASANPIKANAVLLYSTQDCYVVFAVTPTSTTSGFFVPKNTFVALVVPLPAASKIAAIRDSADGKLFVSPLNSD